MRRDVQAGPGRVVVEDIEEVCRQAATGLQALSGKTILVAGAAGFLPSYLVDSLAYANRHLLEVGCRILCVDNLQTGKAWRLAHLAERRDVSFLEHDLVEPFDLDERVDCIIHGASIASPTWYRRHPLETIDVNVTGTRRLLDLARAHGVQSFVYLSSSEVYGDPPSDRVPTSEDYWGNVSPTGPRACYDESKRLAETLCVTYQQLHGIRVVLARPFNVYGPRLRLDDGRVIPDFARNALDGQPITLYSDGRATRSFCYVTDAAVALLLLLTNERATGPYNVGNDQEVTIAEVAETIAALSGTNLGVRMETSDDPHYLTDNPKRRSPDLSKIEKTIDWRPSVDLEKGLERTLAYYREGGAR